MVTIIEQLYQSPLVLENHVVRLESFDASTHTKPLGDIFYDEVLDHMELVVDSNDPFDAYIQYLIKEQNKANESFTFVVYDKRIKAYAGVTRIKNISDFNRRLELGGTWYGKNYQGSGINLACKFELFKYCFESLKVSRVQFTIDSNNVISQRSMLKVGAVREGILRNNYVNGLGESRDDVFYSVISNEWDSLKNKIYSSFL